MLRTVLAPGLALALSFAATLALAQAPSPRAFAPPEPTSWRPSGCRAVPTTDPIIGSRDRWKLLHGDVLNTSEASIALAPMFEADWHAEPSTYNVAGVVFDRVGNLYFAPFLPHENVILISLDPSTGARRWAIAGTGAPVGTVSPMVLNDPDHPGEELVYLAVYDRAVAVRTNGTIVWDVPTGLTLTGVLSQDAVPGLNFDPVADAIVGSTADGHVFLLDRATGAQLLAAPYSLPGSPSASSPATIPASVVNAVAAELTPLIDYPANTPFIGFVDAILGNGIEVSNSFSIDPASGRLWIAATAPDANDGTVDGISTDGAIYGLDVTRAGASATLSIGCTRTFAGGSASTPAMLPDASRAYFGDNDGRLIALDANCGQAWSLDVGGQIVGAIAVSSDNHELYAATQTEIVKVVDAGDHGVVAWHANLDAYVSENGDHRSYNLLLASIGSNGVGVSIGAGLPPGTLAEVALPVAVGYGVLDRETGELRYFADGLEESIAELNIGPDGAYYSPNSPLRRAFARVLNPDAPPLEGGIRKFAPRREDLLVRDALCAAADRAENALAVEASCPASAAADRVQIDDLVAEASRAAEHAISAGDLRASAWSGVARSLPDPSASLADVASPLRSACARVTALASPRGASSGCSTSREVGGAPVGLALFLVALALGRVRRAHRAKR